MQHLHNRSWLVPWRRRTSAWGALLDAQQILLASLVVQGGGTVRVAVLEHQHTPAGLTLPSARDDWLVQQLRAASAPLPRSARRMALALHESRCRQGIFQVPPHLSPQQLAAEVQLEAAKAFDVEPDAVGFDFDVPAPGDAVRWAACLRNDLQLWQSHARRAGWRLPLVEPEHQAARRAAEHWPDELQRLWAQSPQDWQFERAPTRRLDEAEWAQGPSAPQWGALVACGAALGVLA